MSTEPRPVEGWAFPHGCKDAHFFQANATSLCGKWRWLGAIDGGAGASKDCPLCRRKLDARAAAASR